MRFDYSLRKTSGNGSLTSSARPPRPSWGLTSRSASSSAVEELQSHYDRITAAGGVKFWFHGLRNDFITVAERELMLPRSLTKRLVNHARPDEVTEGYAADWSVKQSRKPAQRIADRIAKLINVRNTVDESVG